MPRFLHLADVHLGLDRYDRPERSRDFFLAFQDALEKYAIAPQVDFVLIAGDLFEHRHITPATLNQAQTCCDLLQEAGIPVFAIEGNHDDRPYGTKTSWLRYLADWNKLILLEPEDHTETSVPQYDLWTPETRRGGYIDLPCGVRILGSRWYGASAPQWIRKLAASIQTLPPSPGYTVMMFHHGLEGQIAKYSGALRYEDVLPLKQAGVDYLALGHIHKNYSEQNWIFNPGSVEANSIAENQQQTPRGVYLVELSAAGIQAELKRDYQQRSILRLNLETNKQQTREDLIQAAIAQVQKNKHTQNAIVELRIHGQVGFNRLDLNVRELQDQLRQVSQALIFLLRYDVTGTEYQTPINTEDGPPPREEIEVHVFTDLLAAYTRYSEDAPGLAKGLIELKNLVVDDRSEQELYELARSLLQST